MHCDRSLSDPCHTVELKPRNSEVHSLELYHLATKQAEIYILCVWRANPLKINAIAILLPSEFLTEAKQIRENKHLAEILFLFLLLFVAYCLLLRWSLGLRR